MTSQYIAHYPLSQNTLSTLFFLHALSILSFAVTLAPVLTDGLFHSTFEIDR